MRATLLALALPAGARPAEDRPTIIFILMKDAPFAEVAVPADPADSDAKAGRARLQAALDSLK